MSKENLVRLLEAASSDDQLMQELQSSENFQEIKKLASAQGFDLGDLSAEEANRTMAAMTGTANDAELSDEDLDEVAGGFSLNFEKITRKGIGGAGGTSAPSCQACAS
jgi:predicted ribosomally synthesized peptide with nif11-like leader